MPAWLSALVSVIDWILSLFVDELFADLAASKAEAARREAVWTVQADRAARDAQRGRAAGDAARADAERIAAERASRSPAQPPVTDAELDRQARDLEEASR